jgi:geranylgeranyl diphosphate synthase, type I
MTAPEVPALAAARETLVWSRALVDPVLRAAVDTLPGSTRHIGGYHLGWWDEHGVPEPTPTGTAVRPALVLLCAAVAGGSARGAVPAAVAVELVHNVALLTEDMTGDAVTGQRPPVWRLFGSGPVVLAGDALLGLARRVVAECGHPAAARGVRMLSDTVRGRAPAAVPTQGPTPGPPRTLEPEEPVAYGTTSAQRTAALIGCACALGALFGGAESRRIERMRSFGECLGLAFQHVEDLLGIWGDPSVTGLPPHAHLRNRRRSLPVVHALTSDTPAARDLAALYARTDPLEGAQLRQAAALVARAGGRAWSQAMADKLLHRALVQLEPGDRLGASAELAALARLVTRRGR